MSDTRCWLHELDLPGAPAPRLEGDMAHLSVRVPEEVAGVVPWRHLTLSATSAGYRVTISTTAGLRRSWTYTDKLRASYQARRLWPWVQGQRLRPFKDQGHTAALVRRLFAPLRLTAKADPITGDVALRLELQPGGDCLTLELTADHAFLHCDGAVATITDAQVVDLARTLKGDTHVRAAS